MALRLIAPTTRWHTAWLAAHREWGPGLHEDGFGLGQRTTVGTLGTIADLALQVGVRSPAVTVVGDVVRLSPAWREREGRSVVRSASSTDARCAAPPQRAAAPA